MKTKFNMFSAMTLMVIVSLFTGCIPTYYAPNARNVPAFTEKGQGNGTFSFQFGMTSIGCNVQGALAVSDHIGIMGNYEYFSGREVSSNWNGEDLAAHFKGNMGELGIGYFHTFRDKFVFETYGGFGGSKVETKDGNWYGNGTSSVSTSSYFIQPATGYYKKYSKILLSARFRLVDIREIDYISGSGGSSQPDLDERTQYPECVFFEPAFTFRTGKEKVQFQLQTGISMPLDQSTSIDYDPFNFNIGIVFCISGKKKETTTN